MVLVIVVVQFLAFNGNLSDGSILFDVLRVAIPHVNGEIAKFAGNLELELLAEEWRQGSFDDRRSTDFLLVEGDGAVDVAKSAWRQGMSIKVELLGGGGGAGGIG